MLAVWESLGSAGSSRWVAFFADGDGSFQPEITINGHKPQPTTLGVPPKERWRRFEVEGWGSDEGYFLDFDPIAWALHD